MYQVLSIAKQLVSAQHLRVGASFLGLYLLSTGISWIAFFLLLRPGVSIISPTLEGKRSGIDLSAPKTEVCPLNGKKFTKAERDIWETRRPLTVMIENHEEARPQSGLSFADVVYEAVAEGGITRFLAVFYCGAAAEELKIGPVRSARVYYIDWASEYGDYPLYAHVGGANRPGPADALGFISKYGWVLYNDLNQFSIGFPTFEKDIERLKRPDGSQIATEHQMYAYTDRLLEVAKERSLGVTDKNGDRWDKNFVSWKFKEESGAPGTISNVSFTFWAGHEGYNVQWRYDVASGVWNRENGGKPHTDLDNQEQLQAGNVIMQFARERSLSDAEKHLLYQTTGKGESLIFQNGNVIQATWSKKDRVERTRFFDKQGKEVVFVPGQIWIEILPVGTEISY